MANVSGGEILARTLKNAGVKDVFALQGGHLDAFLVGCVNNNIRLTDTRHEAAAGHAADGYARATGKVGVCTITAGPGFANAYPAIVNALLDGIPTLFLIGAPPLREVETNPLQGGFDQVACAEPVTKWSHRITHTERIPMLVELALRKATTGRPGPVLLEIPIDILFATVDEQTTMIPEKFFVEERPGISKSAVSKVLDMFRSSQKPVILIGGGARFSDTTENIAELAEALNAPVFCNNKAYGVMPPDHPLFGGNMMSLGALKLLEGEGPDLILILGARLGLFTGGQGDMIIPADVKIIQVDISGEEVGRVRDIALPVIADCGEAVKGLLEGALESSTPERPQWLELAGVARTAPHLMFLEAEAKQGEPIHPYLASKAVMEACGENTIIVLDGGEASGWGDYHVNVAEPGMSMTHGYLGCLGTGQGFAMGASRAHPDKKVLLLTGDGSVGFHIQEFDTMLRHDLPIVTVVFNNRCWGMSIHGQQIVYGGNGDIITRLADTNYHEVAIAFGGYGERVTALEEIAPAIERAFASGKPACINVEIDGEVILPMTLAMLGSLNPEEEEIVVPYYENLKG